MDNGNDTRRKRNTSWPDSLWHLAERLAAEKGYTAQNGGTSAYLQALVVLDSQSDPPLIRFVEPTTSYRNHIRALQAVSRELEKHSRQMH